MAYDIKYYKHLLKGSEKYTERGLELTNGILMPEGYELNDSLICQVGEASLAGDEKKLSELLDFCELVRCEAFEYEDRKSNKHKIITKIPKE